MLHDVGQRIRVKRKVLGVSREKFAEIIGITPHFLAQIECGNKGMSTHTLYKICAGLNTSADYILMGRETRNDTTQLAAALENIDPEYYPYIEGVVNSLLLLLNKKEHGAAESPKKPKR